jgi:hypothetical protein
MDGDRDRAELFAPSRAAPVERSDDRLPRRIGRKGGADRNIERRSRDLRDHLGDEARSMPGRELLHLAARRRCEGSIDVRGLDVGPQLRAGDAHRAFARSQAAQPEHALLFHARPEDDVDAELAGKVIAVTNAEEEPQSWRDDVRGLRDDGLDRVGERPPGPAVSPQDVQVSAEIEADPGADDRASGLDGGPEADELVAQIREEALAALGDVVLREEARAPRFSQSAMDVLGRGPCPSAPEP